MLIGQLSIFYAVVSTNTQFPFSPSHNTPQPYSVMGIYRRKHTFQRSVLRQMLRHWCCASSPHRTPPWAGEEGAVASLKSEKYGWAAIIRVLLSVGLQFPCLGAILLALTSASALLVCLVNSTRRRQALPLLHPLPSFRVLLLRKFNAFFPLFLFSLLSCICCVLCACLPLLGFAFVWLEWETEATRRFVSTKMVFKDECLVFPLVFPLPASLMA